MSWTKFKTTYLFSINFAIMLSVILWSVRKDFLWHPAVGVWLVLCFFSPSLRGSQETILKTLGRINSTILLTAFYLLFFSPFSLLYRAFYRNKAFLKSDSRFTPKQAISDFRYPF